MHGISIIILDPWLCTVPVLTRPPHTSHAFILTLADISSVLYTHIKIQFLDKEMEIKCAEKLKSYHIFFVTS